MKKKFTLVLATITCLVFAACNSDKTYEEAKKAYEDYEQAIYEATSLEELEAANDALENLEDYLISPKNLKEHCSSKEQEEIKELSDRTYDLYRAKKKKMKAAAKRKAKNGDTEDLDEDDDE